ncbi:hypothetical protein FRC02_011529 [Tulasnella sp. 418]|nr:hypothetical protein FRC02_011529 [Tulasnella sp. 418]
MSDKGAFQWAIEGHPSNLSSRRLQLPLTGGSHKKGETIELNVLNGIRRSNPASARPLTWMDPLSSSSTSQNWLESLMTSPTSSKRLSTNPFLSRMMEEKNKNARLQAWITENAINLEPIQHKSQSPFNASIISGISSVKAPISKEVGGRGFTPQTNVHASTSSSISELSQSTSRTGNKGVVIGLVSTSDKASPKGGEQVPALRSCLKRSSTTVARPLPTLPENHSPSIGTSTSTLRWQATTSSSASSKLPAQPAASNLLKCSMCRRTCIPSRNPLADYQNFKVSNTVFGIQVPCPLEHLYCVNCIRSIVIRDITQIFDKQQTSPLGCYQCTNHGDVEWKMPLEILDTVFTPQETSTLRHRMASKCNFQTTSSPCPPAKTAQEVYSEVKKGQSTSATATESSVSPTCGICLDPFHAVLHPLQDSSSQTKGKTKHSSLGLVLPCPGKHKYCVNCIAQHVQTELQKGSQDKSVFPIRCPECPQGSWSITDDVAERILGPSLLEKWHFQKLLDSIVKVHCPYPKCSALVEVPSPERLRDATCPACQRMICVKCRAPWHTGLTCAEFADQNTADQLTYDLAKRSGWRRCPRCKMIVERSSGCPHMSCRCGHHFCYRCGSDYTQGACQQGDRCREKPDPTFTKSDAPVSPQESVRKRNTLTRASMRPLSEIQPPVIDRVNLPGPSSPNLLRKHSINKPLPIVPGSNFAPQPVPVAHRSNKLSKSRR